MKGDNGQDLCHWAAMPCDYDNDGDFDFYFALVHGGNDPGEGRSTIVKNQGPDSNYRLRWDMNLTPRQFPYAGHIATYDANWFDFDNDGLTDLCNADGSYVGGGNGRVFMFRQNEDHDFTDITKALGMIGIDYYTQSIARPMDYDKDGDEDLLIWGGGGPNSVHVPVFLKNNIANSNNHIVVKLKPGRGTNGSCVGARVEVYAGSLTKTREVYAGQGNAAGQSQFDLVFGLKQAQLVDSIVVYFPNKKHRRVVVKNVAVNQTFTVYEYINNPPEQSILIYPNPAKGLTNVAFPENFSGPMEIKVYDLSGKVIMEKPFTPVYRYETLDISNLAPGYYILKLKTEDGIESTGRLMVE